MEKHNLQADLYALGITFDDILNCLPGHVYWQDRNNAFLGCNALQAKSAGFSREEIIGKSNHEMPWKEQADALNAINKQVIETGQEFSVEEILKLSDNKEIVFHSKKVPLLDSKNNIMGVLGISFDITKQKELEQKLVAAKEAAESANHLKSKFIQNMEHDIRTPFVGILGMAKMLFEQESDPVKKKMLSAISSCTQELLDYSSAILDFSEVESGSFPVSEKHFNLRTLVESVGSMEVPAAAIKNLDFKVEYDREIPNQVIGDEYRLKRILINLVSNAIKFTSKGFVHLSLKCLREAKRTILVQFKIADSGLGIEDHNLRVLYQKFSRLNRSDKGVHRGQGLGLRIVKQFVDEMDGDIQIESKFGEGTCFTCTFSLKVPLANAI